MAKNISLLGATYPDVPAVTLPQAGGGTADFIEADEITAALSGAKVLKSAGPAGVLTFDDAAAGAMALKVSVEAVQAGSGDPSPSNVRPITGWTGANVSVAGENFFTGMMEQGTISSTGKRNSSTNRIRSAESMELDPGEYTLTAKEPLACGIFFYQLDDTFIERDVWHEVPYTFTVSARQKVAFILAKGSSTSAPDIVPADASEVGVYSDFVTYNISFPSGAGTVYGGTLTVYDDGNGTLVVDKAFYEFDGSSDEVWYSEGNGTYKFARIVVEPFLGRYEPSICNEFVPGTIGNNTSDIGYDFLNTNHIRVRFGLYTSLDVNTIKAFFQNNPMQIVYKIATPVTYALTPGQVLAMAGLNNVWTDAGETEAEYPADVEEIIRKIIS